MFSVSFNLIYCLTLFDQLQCSSQLPLDIFDILCAQPAILKCQTKIIVQHCFLNYISYSNYDMTDDICWTRMTDGGIKQTK